MSNNPYETGDIAGRAAAHGPDEGVLGIVGAEIENAGEVAGLLRRAQRSRNVTVLTAREVVIDADQPHIPVGIDGESVLMPTPVRCTIRPLALRVRVPRDRPGVPDPRPPMDWTRPRHHPLTFTRTKGECRRRRSQVVIAASPKGPGISTPDDPRGDRAGQSVLDQLHAGHPYDGPGRGPGCPDYS